jgi:hypothetical protein
MNNDRLKLAALFNLSAASGAGTASIFAFHAGLPVAGWIAAGVAVANLVAAVYPVGGIRLFGPQKGPPSQGPT